MKAIIEIPKGDNRRRHIKYDKSGFIDLGLIKDVIPVNEGIMPVHYGFIPETLNEKEGDEVDVLILSDRRLNVGQEIEVDPIALIRREDEDDKIVATDETRQSIKKWDDMTESEKILIKNFFSYHHKFLAIEGPDNAKEYIENGRTAFQSK
jgi:inorganic pyrophosphatase